jgi:hypothetical protein
MEPKRPAQKNNLGGLGARWHNLNSIKEFSMKNFIQNFAFGFTFVSLLMACSTNPNKAEDIKTKLDSQEDVGGGQSVGTNDKGEMIVQKKVRLATYLRDLQREVYAQEVEIYGDDSVGRKGLFGVLRDCRDEVRNKKNGGDGKVSPPPMKDIKTAGEDMQISALIEKLKPGQVGRDEQKQLVGVSEDYLMDRIKRFESYRTSYQERKDWFEEEIRKCQAVADNYKLPQKKVSSQSSQTDDNGSGN